METHRQASLLNGGPQRFHGCIGIVNLAAISKLARRGGQHKGLEAQGDNLLNGLAGLIRLPVIGNANTVKMPRLAGMQIGQVLVIGAENPLPNFQILVGKKHRQQLGKGDFLAHPLSGQVVCADIHIPGALAALHGVHKGFGAKGVESLAIKAGHPQVFFPIEPYPRHARLDVLGHPVEPHILTAEAQVIIRRDNAHALQGGGQRLGIAQVKGTGFGNTSRRIEDGLVHGVLQ